MFTPERFSRRVFCTLAIALLTYFFNYSGATHVLANPATPADLDNTSQRLESGEILVDCEEYDGIKYVVGRVLIDETAENLWPILVNPYEFQGKICQRMKRVEILNDLPNISLLGYTVALVFPLPDLNYTVESKYTACSRIEFQRTAGSFKDFRGFWKLQPNADGRKTEVIYSMYLDPGVPVPDWLVRIGVKSELPAVLAGLRSRIECLKNAKTIKEKRNIAAASAYLAKAND